MALENHLKPGETVQYQSRHTITYDEKKYRVYVTEDRLLLYARRGLIIKKDDLVTWRLTDITRTNYQENGLLGLKGTVLLEVGDGEEIELNAGKKRIKPVYHECTQLIQ